MIEASEESSSVHLAEHLTDLLPRFGQVDLVIALDSFCESYDRLWTTTSTRGVAGGVLDIEVCARRSAQRPCQRCAAVVVPHPAAVARPDRGQCHRCRARPLGQPLGSRPTGCDEATGRGWSFPTLSTSFRPLPGVRSMRADAAEELLAETWRPALEVIGVDGLPPVADAGNVFRSRLSVKFSLRLPPTADVMAVGRS
jgi:hypothetical protein